MEGPLRARAAKLCRMTRVYLDYNATTPLRPEALAAMRPVLEQRFGNPSSVHWAGAEARETIERARGQVADLLGVASDSIVFMSSATEANNTVLRSALSRSPAAGDHVVTCATEHPSVLECLEELRGQGLRTTILPVEADGRLDPDRFRKSLDERTLLASVMWANNETGIVQPISVLAAIASERGVRFHTDAVQALGKLPLSLGELPVDFASFSAHKLGGPKGSGVLYARAGSRFAPLLRGGPQEAGRRAGTENVAGIAGFGAACEAAGRELERESQRLGELRDRLWEGIAAAVPDVGLNSPRERSLAHTLNVSFAGVDAEVLVEALDVEGVAVASGAACHSGSTEPSHVLLAMGVPLELAAGSVRFSLGSPTRADEIERVLELLPGLVERVRATVRAERATRRSTRR